MLIKQLTDQYYVSSQIAPEDLPELTDKGFRTVICNRPDGEDAGQPTIEQITSAASATSTIEVHYLPIISGQLSLEDAEAQGELLASVEGPVLAYCRTGTRCTILWALHQARSGQMPPYEIQQRARSAGYDISNIVEQFA